MKKIFLEIGLFINSFFTIVSLYLSLNYEITSFEESGIENLASIFFIPIFIFILSIALFIIDIILSILAHKYLKNTELVLSTFNVNKCFDILQLIIFLMVLLFASKSIISHNWFGLILSTSIIGQMYLYIMWTLNIYKAKKLLNS